VRAPILYHNLCSNLTHSESNEALKAGETKGQAVRHAILIALMVTFTAVTAPPAHAGSGGDPFNGWITGAEPFPQGPHHRLQHHVRQSRTYFATTALIDGLLRAVGAVAKAHPDGEQTLIGNLSKRNGGNIPDSRTHNSGRDVDIVFFMERLDGRAVRPNNHHYGRDGLSRRSPKHFRFDIEANWALIEALASNQAMGLQWVIIEPHLELLMLKHAKAQGLSGAELRRYADLMTLPPYAGPHENHMHLRIQCPVADWQDRCQPTGPVWQWNVHHLPPIVAMAKEHAAGFKARKARDRAKAIETAWAKGLTPLVAEALPLLDDPDQRVRRRARKMLLVLIDPETAPRALEVAETLKPVSRRLVTLWVLRRGGLAALPTAEAVMAGTHPTVSPKPRTSTLRDLQVAARRLLIRERPVAELLGLD